jgi:hypothetical protein
LLLLQALQAAQAELVRIARHVPLLCFLIKADCVDMYYAVAAGVAGCTG